MVDYFYARAYMAERIDAAERRRFASSHANQPVRGSLISGWHRIAAGGTHQPATLAVASNGAETVCCPA